jgi:hypothetical protein
VRSALLFSLTLLAGCAVKVGGSYQGVLPAASGGGERFVRVTLKDGGSAALNSTFSGGGREGALALGKWQRDGGTIEIQLEEPSAERMVFRRAGNDLLPREWDRTIWGDAGPGVLTRVR